jgi:hypothetical protein
LVRLAIPVGKSSGRLLVASAFATARNESKPVYQLDGPLATGKPRAHAPTTWRSPGPDHIATLIAMA